ncbi:MAG: flippase-like domain-containing protein [Elainella sp. Prado103]|jgi:hypothetical protein|nr:flippase-like domain-containing protein [Elainella sp. Prado103]
MAIVTPPDPANSVAKWRKWGYLGFGTAITLILLAWAFQGVSLVAVGQALQRAQWGWLILGWLAYLACYVVRAMRWQTLLGQQGRFQTYLAAIFIGFGAGSILPGYGAEVIRAIIPARLDRIPFAAAFGSIFAERILDLGVVFLFLLIPVWWGALPAKAHHLPLGWLGGAILLIWLILVAAASHPAWVIQQVNRLCCRWGLRRWRSPITASLTHFLAGLAALRRPQQTGIALLQTIGIWGFNAITYWAGLLALGITAPGLLGALLTQSLTALAIVLPSTPGYVGAFEAGIRFSLNLYQVPIDQMIAYAIALRFLMYVTIPVIALAIAARLGLAQEDWWHPPKPDP